MQHVGPVAVRNLPHAAWEVTGGRTRRSEMFTKSRLYVQSGGATSIWLVCNIRTTNSGQLFVAVGDFSRKLSDILNTFASFLGF